MKFFVPGSESPLAELLVLSSFLVLIASGCEDTPNEPDIPPATTTHTYFLMGYDGSGDLGSNPGMVLVSTDGQSIRWVSGYFPYESSTAYVDQNNGRIAFAAQNPPGGSSPIAYMDENDLADIKFLPVVPSHDNDYYWVVPAERPQVMDDGRIIIRAIYNTVNPYDDYQDGMLAIYDPATGEYETSGSLSGFVLSQPEQGDDTEGGSMGTSFALSPDNTFVILTAFGAGTEGGVYHEDYRFLVKYDIAAKTYSRVALGSYTIYFVSNDNSKVIVDSGSSKYAVVVGTGDQMEMDTYTAEVSSGMHALLSNKFIKIWRGSGMAMFDVNSGWLYNQIDGSTLSGSFKGLGGGAQFSSDESRIYFTASSDYYTNYSAPFEVMSTPVDLGSTDDNPDSLFVLGAEFDTYLFVMINR